LVPISEIILRRSSFGWTIGAWLLSAAASLVMQRDSWWEYHFNIFFVPVGLMAAVCLQRLLTGGASRVAANERWAIAIVCSAIATTAVVVPVAKKVQSYWLAGPSPFSDLVAFSIRVDPTNAQLRDSVSFLNQPGSLPGRIAIFGDGRIFSLANREAIPFINGTAPFLVEQIEHSARLIATEKPMYVYVYPFSWKAFAGGSNAVMAILKRDYSRFATDSRAGLWCELKGPRQPPVGSACDVSGIAAAGHSWAIGKTENKSESEP
jgi:hypothetical protein